MKFDINNYPGAKTNSGLAEWILNHIPEFNHFNEVFAGSAEISERLMKLCPNASYRIIELSKDVFHQLRLKHIGKENVGVDNVCGFTFINWMLDNYKLFQEIGYTESASKSHFNYFDPPYMMSTRQSQRNIYEFEWEDNTHDYFLECIKKLSDFGAKIMISHPPCEKYDRQLIDNGWFYSDMNTITRSRKIKIERIYMNYDITKMKLSTPVYIGADRTDRQRIKRKLNSLRRKIKQLSIHEKQLFDKLSEE